MNRKLERIDQTLGEAFDKFHTVQLLSMVTDDVGEKLGGALRDTTTKKGNLLENRVSILIETLSRNLSQNSKLNESHNNDQIQLNSSPEAENNSNESDEAVSCVNPKLLTAKLLRYVQSLEISYVKRKQIPPELKYKTLIDEKHEFLPFKESSEDIATNIDTLLKPVTEFCESKLGSSLTLNTSCESLIGADSTQGETHKANFRRVTPREEKMLIKRSLRSLDVRNELEDFVLRNPDHIEKRNYE
jgi:hypothetical protein